MKFTKFGKALLMSALSVAIIFGVSSCVESYTVGFLYVTGTLTAGTAGQGIISGFKIDHNTGRLKMINTLPVASGGSYPVRAVLLTGSRFLYVLNKGTNAQGGIDWHRHRSLPGKYYRVCGWRQRRPDSAGDVLHARDQPVPHDRGRAGQLSLRSGPRLSVSRSLLFWRWAAGVTTCAATSQRSRSTRRPGGLQLVVNAQVTAANGSRTDLLPGAGQPNRFLSFVGIHPDAEWYDPATGDSVFPYTYSQAYGPVVDQSEHLSAAGDWCRLPPS